MIPTQRTRPVATTGATSGVETPRLRHAHTVWKLHRRIPPHSRQVKGVRACRPAPGAAVWSLREVQREVSRVDSGDEQPYHPAMSRDRKNGDRPNITITYHFEFNVGDPVTYELELDGETLSLVVDEDRPTPEWTRLDFCRCEACKLDSAATAHCPVAVNLNQAATRFRAEASIKQAKVTVTTKERTYFKETSLNNALYSLFGLIMSTTDCAVVNFLKPMARFHLPFASMDETVMRTTSTYLLGQYFAAKHGRVSDYGLEKLDEHYRHLSQLNHAFSKRLSRITSGDAEHNAINVLNNFACMTAFEVQHELKHLAYLWNRD